MNMNFVTLKYLIFIIAFGSFSCGTTPVSIEERSQTKDSFQDGENLPNSKDIVEKKAELRPSYDLLWESYDPTADKWFAWLHNSKDGGFKKLFESDGPPREQVPISLQHPTWSKDGRYLAYYLEEKDNYLIYEYDFSTGKSKQVTVGIFPYYSPDGNHLIYCATSQKTGEQELWVYGRDGSDQRVTSLKQTCMWPSWSPNGENILFTSFDETWNIYLLNTKNWKTTPFSQGDLAREKAIWSPNGHRIAHWLLQNDDIVIQNLKGDMISTIKKTEDSTYKLGGFSLDGNEIVVTEQFGGGIFIHNCSTRKLKEICRLDGFVRNASYSPDGRWIAFQFNKTSLRKNRGRWDIYIVSSSGGNPICLTKGFENHSFSPTWRPKLKKAPSE